MPKISIGLPCYNEAPFIEETLRSILAQSEADFELIVCDNASTDGTLDIIHRVVAGDARVTVHAAEKNLGAPANYERAAALATSPYYMWMGAHDVLDKEYLKRLRLVLDADATCAIAFADSIYIARDGSAIPGEQVLVGPDMSSHNVVDRIKALIWQMKRCDIYHALMRRSLLDPKMVYQSRASDMVILCDMALKGRCLRVPHLMFFRRKNRDDEGPDAIEARLLRAGILSPGDTLAKSMTGVRDAHLALLDGKGFSESVRQELRAVICQGFKDRHQVPWDATEAATAWERLRLKLASGPAQDRLKEEIAQRVAAHTRVTDSDSRRRLERELVALLKENHRLQREVTRLKKR